MSAKPMTKKEWQEYVDKAWGEAAVLAEREACAKVCESQYIADGSHEDVAAMKCAAAIRARGQA